MLWQNQDPATKWYPTDKKIEAWLHERQQLIGLLGRVLQVHPFEEENDPALMTEFCQLLVDYVSAGHFEIFEKIAESTQAPDPQALDAPGVASSIIREIEETTQRSLAFTNQYTDVASQTKQIEKELAQLAEILAERLDLEDILIQTYVKHREQAS